MWNALICVTPQVFFIAPHIFSILPHMCEYSKEHQKKGGGEVCASVCDCTGRCVPLCVNALRFSILAFLSFLLPFL